MKLKEYNWKENPLTAIAVVVAAVWGISIIFKMIFLGFQGPDAYWMVAAAAFIGISLLQLSGILNKFLAGTSYIGLVFFGMLISISISGTLFFSYLLEIVFFIIMLFLFAILYLKGIEKAPTMLKTFCGVYLFLMILPISAGKIPLQWLFYWNFKRYSPEVFLYWIPLLIGLWVVIGSVLKNLGKLPEKIKERKTYQIAFISGGVYLVYHFFREIIYRWGLYGGLRGFLGSFFSLVFLYSICLAVCIGVLVLIEARKGKIELAVKKG